MIPPPGLDVPAARGEAGDHQLFAAMEERMARTPQEVFGHHAQALMAGDVDGIVEDYTDDAIFITPALQTVRYTVQPKG
jgi:hypothetical protein